jgi:predicted RNA binding protein with dsRBD fold (UPF0201 family)
MSGAAKNSLQSATVDLRPVTVKSKMDRQVTVRCTAEDAHALEQLQAQLEDVSIAHVARAAMREGLRAIAGDASRIILKPRRK